MCELLALSTSHPARLTFSLHTLAARGAGAGTMHDGWGVAFYQGRDVALFREPQCAGDSELVRYLEKHGPRTQLAISHIRHATQGTVQFSNTQPFIRELGGRTHVFAHNGNLTRMEDNETLGLATYHPIGQTDSEYAFCALLAHLQVLWGQASAPSLDARMALLAAFAAQLRALGPANFLYSDGDALFVHGHRRLQRDSGRAGPPGLWMLTRQCEHLAAPPAHEAGVSIASEPHDALFIASVPLTDEDWRPLAEGELVAVRNGMLIMSDANSDGAHAARVR